MAKTTSNANRAAANGERLEKETEKQMPLTRINFILMAAAALIIIIGFLLMCGPGSTETEFNPDIFSARRIVIGPAMAFLGFLFMGAAIMWPDKKSKNTTAKE